MKLPSISLALSLLCSLAWGSAHAKTWTFSPEESWFACLDGESLEPGDAVVLRGGTYTDRRRLAIRHRGTKQKPIVIRAATGERVIFQRPDANQNSLNLEGAQYLHLIGIEITGGAAGIRIGPNGARQASHVVLDGLHIHHIGGVAVTCNFPGATYEAMTFRRNHIHHTSGHGEGFYLGGNDASAIFFDSSVENNYIHDLNGADVTQGDGIEVKHGSFGNRIVGNIIHDTNYPGVTVYGTNGKSRNLIQDNLIWNSSDHGIQAASDAVIRSNFVAAVKGSGIYSRKHQAAVPGNLLVEANRVLRSTGPALRVIGIPDANSRSSEIEIVGNVFLSRIDGIAIRLDHQPSVTLHGNGGRGALLGFEPSPKSWDSKVRDVSGIPLLPENPAWKSLSRMSVRSVFGVTNE